MESIETISNHVMALYAAKILAYTKQNKTLDIELEHKSSTGAIYIHNSRPGISQIYGPQYEKKFVFFSFFFFFEFKDFINLNFELIKIKKSLRIDESYLDLNGDKVYRLETYRSKGTVSSYSSTQLRCYFLTKCEFANPNVPSDVSDLSIVGDKTFLERATPNTKKIYQRIMDQAVKRTGPVIETFEYDNSHERRLVIAYK